MRVCKNKNASLRAGKFCIGCDPAGIRTQDPYIKSVMLYRLSYGIIFNPHCCGITPFSQEPPHFRGTFRVRADLKTNISKSGCKYSSLIFNDKIFFGNIFYVFFLPKPLPKNHDD